MELKPATKAAITYNITGNGLTGIYLYNNKTTNAILIIIKIFYLVWIKKTKPVSEKDSENDEIMLSRKL